MFIFRKQYFYLTLILFVIEIFIAAVVHDRIIRPYIGDFLVVILIYCFIRTFFNISIIKAALGVLLFAYFIEILQFFEFIKKLGLQHSVLAKIILGNFFEWIDLVAYTLGIALVIAFEKLNLPYRMKNLFVTRSMF